MANLLHNWLTSGVSSETAHRLTTNARRHSTGLPSVRSGRPAVSTPSAALGALLCALGTCWGCAGEKSQMPPAQNAAANSSAPSDAASPAGPEEANEAQAKGADGSAPAAAAPEMDENGETRTTKVVTDIVKAHRDEVRQCFDTVEEKYPGIHGDVVIRFVIAPDGHVQSTEFAKAESTLLFQELADCMMAKMKAWKFPPSSLGMESRIGYPFNFNPKR